MTAPIKISASIDVHVLKGVHLQAFWVLDWLSSDVKDRFSSADIASYLIETCHINTSRQAISYALDKDKTMVHKNKSGYKLMDPGRKSLLEQTRDGGVIFVEAGKPFSAKNIALKDIFGSLQGEILICDPYIDIQTLDAIFKTADKGKYVKILTQNIIDKPTGTFLRHLSELRKEGYQIDIGVYTNSELHDRYIMDGKTFWLSGNSLNHLGSKESFLVRLGDDIRQSMLSTFNQRWKISVKA